MINRFRHCSTGTLMVSIVCASLAFGAPADAFAVQAGQLDDINAEMTDLRELEQHRDVEITYKDRKTLQDETVGDLTTDYPEEDQLIDERILVAFGLLEPDQDIGDLYAVLYGGQVAGYYDPATKEMVLVSDSTSGGELTASDKATYSHEFVHALQDQNFQLGQYIDLRIASPDDQSMAVTSLIEGDATAAQIEYLRNHLDIVEELQNELDASVDSQDELDGVPPILVETLYFPYNQGYEFIEKLRDEGGWDLVNESYLNPPTSSEQILHPEKYLDDEQPVECKVVDVEAALGMGWNVFDVNTFGEFQISILLESDDVSSREAEAAAAGWGGDSYVVAGNADSEVIYWKSTWDTDDDATEFVDALVAREAGRLSTEPEVDGDVVTLPGEDHTIRITRSGTDVTYAYAADQQIIDTLENAPEADGAPILTLGEGATPTTWADAPVAWIPGVSE